MDLLAQMATFVRVVDGNSLSAAARAQRLSLPAISRQLSALESDLGATLIVRSTRKLHVTDAGRQWYEHCIRVIREIDEARASVRDTKTVRGTIVVSASLTFGSVLLVPRLRKVVEKHPQLVVDLRLEDQLVDLVGEGVHIAIRAGAPPPDSTSFVAHPLFPMDRILVAAPRWLKKHGMPRQPEHLARHDCLIQITPAGNVIRWTLRREDVVRTVDVRGRVRTNAPIALRDLAVDGLGVAYLPDWLVTGHLADGRLRRVLPEWASPPITAWAVYRVELRGTPRVRAFLEAIPHSMERGEGAPPEPA
jgi:DNA-binding transcriptional LysR family regulator